VEIQALCSKVNQLIISEGIEIENGRTSSLVTPRNIRYYCTIGLMPPPKRLDSKSTYDDSHVEAVLSIKRSQMAGLSLKEIRASQHSEEISSVFKEALNTNGVVLSSMALRSSLSEIVTPMFSLTPKDVEFGWSVVVGDCHLSGYGLPPSRDQLSAITKILSAASPPNDEASRA
jgi:DNA-binding transcriptional MerR regulator